MKRVLWVVFILMIGVVFLEVKNTYSLFETDSTISVSSELANWNVKINDSYITDLTTESNTIELGEISWDSMGHVVSGKAAPGSIGKFNIEIDPTDTEVSFVYELVIDLSSLDNNEFFIEYVNEINDYELVRTGENTYSSIVTLKEIESGIKHNIEVGLRWNNNEDNNMSDYELGSSVIEGIDIPISISLRQYTGEGELIEYVEDSEMNEAME